MTRKGFNKFIALFVCVLFLTVSLLAIAFICKHAKHDCSGQGCAVCEQLTFASNLYKRIAVTLASTSSICLACFLTSPFLFNIISNFISLSPITLRVRMNH